ncbi:Protein CBG05755 [Caenorhabditis briggsae]|uniref:G-protein coupled receptors family 1 profile domain-containing protein n=2 Tax=Caenorhabditis briggsae TaxID=6238 RepID=A0AAE9AAW1_CAEBR|nr:Protein CBG05755 [Caenorhabditis briggsae]ULT94936.1 hypothetical protein L3Y34_003992 [Caenorhabditis briggsae]CAP26561.1 Protein CBG05755 [Caenorhabditis briggsae]
MVQKRLVFVITEPFLSVNVATYSQVLMAITTLNIKEIARRLSSWLGVLLASIRILIIRSSLNPKLNYISKRAFGIQSSFFSLIISIIVSAFYFGPMTFEIQPNPWVPPSHCAGFPANYTEPQYLPSFKDFLFFKTETSLQIYFLADGFLKIASAVLLPILTICLIIALQNARRQISVSSLRSPTENAKTDSTTKLVIFMTMTFMVADGPIGVVSLAQGILMEQNMMVQLMTAVQVISILNIFVTFNASIHCIICLLVSSPYRDTAKSAFCCREENPNTIFKSSRVSATGMSNARGQRISN